MRVIDYISQLRNELSKDYKNVTDRTLIHLMNQFRAIQIKNELNQNKFIPRELKQFISGIEMNISNQIDVPFISDNSRILKSKQIIPNLIHLSNKELVTRIFSGKVLDKDYNFITPEQAIYAGNGKTNKKRIFVFIYNDYLYIKLKKENPNINLISNVSLEGIFENPLDLITLTEEPGFDFLNYEYPITITMWAYIKSNLLKNGFNIIQSELQE